MGQLIAASLLLGYLISAVVCRPGGARLLAAPFDQPDGPLTGAQGRRLVGHHLGASASASDAASALWQDRAQHVRQAMADESAAPTAAQLLPIEGLGGASQPLAGSLVEGGPSLGLGTINSNSSQETSPTIYSSSSTAPSSAPASNANNVLELSAFEAAHYGYFRHSTLTSVILTVAYTIVFVVGIVGNSFVVAIVCKSPRMRTVTNYFIANLALADILVLLFCLPATLVGNLFIRKCQSLGACWCAKTVSLSRSLAIALYGPRPDELGVAPRLLEASLCTGGLLSGARARPQNQLRPIGRPGALGAQIWRKWPGVVEILRAAPIGEPRAMAVAHYEYCLLINEIANEIFSTTPRTAQINLEPGWDDTVVSLARRIHLARRLAPALARRDA